MRLWDLYFNLSSTFVTETVIIEDNKENENRQRPDEQRPTKKKKLETETDLKILRIRNIIEKEQQIAQITITTRKNNNWNERNTYERITEIGVTRLSGKG